jgi:homoserine O-acetyltransferase
MNTGTAGYDLNSRSHSRIAAATEARAGRHAPSDALTLLEGIYELPTPLPLHHGGTLERARIGWRLHGARDAPVIVALGGISAHRRVFDLESPKQGWWHEIAGAARALDCTRVRILGIDFLGGSGSSTGPIPGSAFPSLSSRDQAEALRRLLDHLQIPRLRAIVGASYGGMVALSFAAACSERVEQLLVISAADRAHPMATAWRCVQRRIVRAAIAAGRPGEGLEMARALAMTTYRSPEEFAARFAHPPRLEAGLHVFPVEDYLFARGRDFAARYRPESFLCLSESIDLHAVDAARIDCPTIAVAVREDLLVPIGDMRALVARLPNAQLREISSPHGHDAFLKEAGQLQTIFEALYGVS